MSMRPVLHILGIFLLALATSMIFPMLTDLYFSNSDWRVFFICVMITSFFGGILFITTRGKAINISPKQGFIMIAMSWFVLCFFSALPFYLSELKISFTDAFFEAVSGLTTTGSTVLTGLDTMPKGILIWRALLQWLGGIGIIIMAFSVLPFLKIGGMQLFQTELSEYEKVIPRSAQFASTVSIIYAALTTICAIFYFISGMNGFDSLFHSMTTIATGGFSNYDSSFFHHTSPYPLMNATVFMIMGGIPFVLYLRAIRGSVLPIFHDPQVRWFLSILAAGILSIIFYLALTSEYSFEYALLHSAFNTTSLMTGTGYASADYQSWGIFPMTLLFFIMFVGACAGSTSCGIKIFRFQVAFAVMVSQIKKSLYPSGVFIPQYSGRTISDDIAASVMGFFFVYVLSIAFLAMALAATGLDFITALSGAATAISNVGPGFGEIIGPAGNFSALSDAAKWLLSLGMLLGRLEIFTILVLLTPHFWRK